MMSKNLLVSLLSVWIFSACSQAIDGTLVKNIEEFNAAVERAKPGDQIILANGIWKDTELVLKGDGQEGNPIKLIAQDKGKVFLEGESNLRIGGSYLHVEGLVFRNGHTPTGQVISFRINKENLCNNCRVTECVIDDYNPSERFESDYWVAIYGKNNRFDHNYLVGKRNQGVTLAVRLDTEESRENHHRIDHNYFGYHQILGSNGGETFRIGTSHYSLTNSNTLVEDNYFERCNGEHEIISNKSCQNTFRNNSFYECQGTLTMRHGNETLVENNYFFGNGKANTGGIRIINETQTVKNNYMQGLTGYRFRGALVIMNGVPNSPLNRYFQVIDSKATHNTIINCDYVQLCAGSDAERSAVPENTIMHDNIFYNEDREDIFTVYDDVSGIDFQNNLLSPNLAIPKNQGRAIEPGFARKALTFESQNGIQKAVDHPEIGPNLEKEIPNAQNTGVSWYPKKDYEIHFSTGKVISVPAGENSLFDAVKQSSPGDILELGEAANYTTTKVIKIPHTLTIRAKEGLSSKPKLTFERTNLFQIDNGGALTLSGLLISGETCDDKPGNSVITTSRYSMINNYKLMIRDTDFHDLDVNHSFNVLKVYKNTFADSILMANCKVDNVTGHVFALDKEIDDIGIYNVENMVIDGCDFSNIGGIVLNLHRGGRDESTFGPILDLSNTTFDQVGHDKRNKYQAAVSLFGAQLVNMKNLKFSNSKKVNLHLIVGDPVINVEDTHFDRSEGITSNDDAWNRKNITYSN